MINNVKKYLFKSYLYMYTNKIINIFSVCASNVCPTFTFVIFGTLKTTTVCLWIILFLRSSSITFLLTVLKFQTFFCGKTLEKDYRNIS